MNSLCLFLHCHQQAKPEVASPFKVTFRNVLKNKEIHSFEVAIHTGGIVATFLHTGGFNILRRLGSRAKRKISENQRFSEICFGLIDLFVTPERLELSTH